MENTNKMYCKPVYKCGICGAEYPTVAERMKCEQACIKKQEEDAKRLAEEKKKAEQDARRIEVTNAIDNAYDLLEKYMKDYGTYNYNGKNLSVFDDILSSKFLHHFLF